MTPERFEQLVASLRTAVSELDADRMPTAHAQRIVDVLSEGERLCQAGRAVAAARVLQERAWRAAGYRTPATWLAARTHKSLGQAISAMETAHRLTRLPATREAFVAGRLSEVQAAEISAAAAADPASEGRLLAVAERETVSRLREQCRQVRAAVVSDEDSSERIRRGRYFRHWSDVDGAVRLDARLAPDDGARLISVVTTNAAGLQAEAGRSGQREPAEAYAADALVGLVAGKGAPKAVVHVHVDAAAMQRGRTQAGEMSRIEGTGPVPVATVRRLANDGIIKALATRDSDVVAVAHLGRTIPARLRTALEARDPVCVVPGCEVRTGLEIDHIIPLSEGGRTCLENLCRLCRWHHAQKTHHGWVISGPPGEWRWTRGKAAAGQREQPPRAP